MSASLTSYHWQTLGFDIRAQAFGQTANRRVHSVFVDVSIGHETPRVRVVCLIQSWSKVAVMRGRTAASKVARCHACPEPVSFQRRVKSRLYGGGSRKRMSRRHVSRD